MEAYRRRQAIQALLRDTGEVEIDDLAQRLGVSPNSIRNDLDSLAAEGQLSRVRGGAVTLEANGSPRAAFVARTSVQRREKEAIGRWAASLIKDGDAIILDDSSSVFQLATFLRERRNLTVVLPAWKSPSCSPKIPPIGSFSPLTAFTPTAHP